MTHRVLLVLTGVFVFLIGALLLISPESYLQVYATDYVAGMDFPARRFSAALLGLGVLLILARDLPPGSFLVALCGVTGVVFWIVAGTGVSAWMTGVAKPAILIAVLVEVILGALFLWAALSVRRIARSS